MYFNLDEIMEILKQKDRFNDNLPLTSEDAWDEMLAAKVNAQLFCLGIGGILTADYGKSSATSSDSSYVNTSNYVLNLENLQKDSRFTPEFIRAVMGLCEELQIRLEDLLVCMAFETGGSFSPSKVNRLSGATGLIQFMPSTARGLGTTVEALRSMTQIQQLEYVRKYLIGKGLAGRSFADIYMSILFPVAVGKSDDFVLFGKGAINGPKKNPELYRVQAYTQNKGLDLNANGSITKYEAAAQAWQKGVRHLKNILNVDPYLDNENSVRGRSLKHWSDKYG